MYKCVKTADDFKEKKTESCVPKKGQLFVVHPRFHVVFRSVGFLCGVYLLTLGLQKAHTPLVIIGAGAMAGDGWTFARSIDSNNVPQSVG